MMQLRPYQIDISNAACDLLNRYKIAYLNMQVRTGKTLTSLNTAKIYGAKNVLFITKKKAIESICADYKAFNPGYNLYVTNYEQLHNIGDPKQFDLIIIDEAHSLGQFPIPSERTKQLKIVCQMKPIIFLSGTPSPESYSQLFHQFWVSTYSPFPHPSFYKWAKDYVSITHKYVFNRTINDYTNADKLLIENATKHLFLTISQEDAGFTELVSEHIHHVKMQDVTYNLIKRLRKDRILVGKDGDIVEADTEVKLLSKLHQICSGTVLFDGGTDMMGKILDETKPRYIINTFGSRKMAIFYKFRSEHLMLEYILRSNGYDVTTDPQQFNKTDHKTVFISQFQSGREGINLSSADCLICMNIDFSAVTYFQVIARIQTKNRTKPAEVHWIFCENGIEDRIYQVVKAKKNYTLKYFQKDISNFMECVNPTSSTTSLSSSNPKTG